MNEDRKTVRVRGYDVPWWTVALASLALGTGTGGAAGTALVGKDPTPALTELREELLGQRALLQRVELLLEQNATAADKVHEDLRERWADHEARLRRLEGR